MIVAIEPRIVLIHGLLEPEVLVAHGVYLTGSYISINWTLLLLVSSIWISLDFSLL